MSISATGFFSAGNEAAVSGVIGLQSIEVDYTLYTLIPQTDGFIKYINSNVTGCPCGGQWQKGVSRKFSVRSWELGFAQNESALARLCVAMGQRVTVSVSAREAGREGGSK